MTFSYIIHVFLGEVIIFFILLLNFPPLCYILNMYDYQYAPFSLLSYRFRKTEIVSIDKEEDRK